MHKTTHAVESLSPKKMISATGKAYGSRNASDANPIQSNELKGMGNASIGTSYRNSKDMAIPLENDELKMRSERQVKERIHTGGFRAQDEVESVSALLESDGMSERDFATNASAMSKEHKVQASNMFQSPKKKKIESPGGDPLKGLKKGLLMSTVASPPTGKYNTINSNNLNVTLTSKLYYQGGKHISLGSSEVAPANNVALTRNMLDLSPLSSVTASYANVDFLAVPEPYKII